MEPLLDVESYSDVDFSEPESEENNGYKPSPSSEPVAKKRKVIRFSVAQTTHLASLYQKGMRGVARGHAAMIKQAAVDTNLTVD